MRILRVSSLYYGNYVHFTCESKIENYDEPVSAEINTEILENFIISVLRALFFHENDAKILGRLYKLNESSNKT